MLSWNNSHTLFVFSTLILASMAKSLKSLCQTMPPLTTSHTATLLWEKNPWETPRTAARLPLSNKWKERTLN